MNQLDTIRRAKGYLEQLNQGIDPITGEQLPPDSLVRQEPLNKRFFYTVGNLSAILQEDGEQTKEPFCLTEQQRKQLAVVPHTVSLSVFLQQVNGQVDRDKMVQLANTTVYRWLEEQGYLEDMPGTSGRKKRPTQQGTTLGIQLKQINDPRGAYQMLTFDPSAQQFLLDHLQDISEFRKKTPRSHGGKKIPLNNPTLLWVNQVWMEQLARGVDPTTGNLLPPEDVLCRKRLQKCFDFVARMLGQVLQNGHFSAKKPFSLPHEQWSHIAVGAEDALSSLVGSINSLIQDPTAMCKLSQRQLTGWLLQQGIMFETLSDKGRQVRRFTQKGEQMGFFVKTEVNDEGREVPRLCGSRAAQQYLVEHLAEIIAFGARG